MVQPFIFPNAGPPLRTVAAPDEPAIKGLESHLYVVEFGEYGVKVGITAAPQTRMAQHSRDGRNFGRPATRGWISEPHVEARANESNLIKFCNALTGAPSARRKEYFAASFERVWMRAAELPKTRGDREAFEARCEAIADGFISFVMGGRR